MVWSAPSHYINQCWNVVNWAIRNKLQWNRTRNSYIFIPKNAFENVVGKMAAILSRPHCANHVACVIAVSWCVANLFALGRIELHPDICYGLEFRAGEMDDNGWEVMWCDFISQVYKMIVGMFKSSTNFQELILVQARLTWTWWTWCWCPPCIEWKTRHSTMMFYITAYIQTEYKEFF